MTIKRYLESRLKEYGKYKLTAQDKELIETKGIEEYIFKKLCSKKYRKWALDADQKEMIKNRLIQIRHNQDSFEVHEIIPVAEPHLPMHKLLPYLL